MHEALQHTEKRHVAESSNLQIWLYKLSPRAVLSHSIVAGIHLIPPNMSTGASYVVAILGEKDGRDAAVRAGVTDRLSDLGLDEGTIAFIDETKLPLRDRRLPLMAIFFGGSTVPPDSSQVADLIEDSVVIAPVVTSLDRVSMEIPVQLRGVNALALGADNSGLDRLVSLVLETFQLLRRVRRLFISYRRDDAQPFAERLYDALDARGFDVFIDVRSVPPAVDFQSELWHRMSDSDIVVLTRHSWLREESMDDGRAW